MRDKKINELLLKINRNLNELKQLLKAQDLKVKVKNYEGFCEVYKNNKTDSNKKLAEKLGVCKRTIQRYVKKYNQL